MNLDGFGLGKYRSSLIRLHIAINASLGVTIELSDIETTWDWIWLLNIAKTFALHMCRVMCRWNLRVV